MRFVKTLPILLLFFMGPLAHATDNCGLNLSANNVSIIWDLGYSALAVQITLQKANAMACDYWLGFTKGGGADSSNRRMISGGNLLKYQLYRENSLSNVLKDNSDGPIPSAANVIAGSFPAGANLTQTLVYYIDIPYGYATSPTLAHAGSYTDSFIINIYEGSDPTIAGAIPVPRPASVTVTATVSAMIGISLVSSGGAFDPSKTTRSADFGTLQQGATYNFDLVVRTNAGFNVTFSSDNNGYLNSTKSGVTSKVPYLLYANGLLLNLSNSHAVPVSGLGGAGQTGLAGLAYPVRIVIGSLAGPGIMGGPHSDTVLISATTTE